MKVCPECHGEGKVRTTKEEWVVFGKAAKAAVVAFASVWVRRATMVGGVLAITPAAGTAGYGLARFFAFLTGAALQLRADSFDCTHYGRDCGGPTTEVAMLVTLAMIVGIVLTIFGAVETLRRWNR